MRYVLRYVVFKFSINRKKNLWNSEIPQKRVEFNLKNRTILPDGKTVSCHTYLSLQRVANLILADHRSLRKSLSASTRSRKSSTIPRSTSLSENLHSLIYTQRQRSKVQKPESVLYSVLKKSLFTHNINFLYPRSLDFSPKTASIFPKRTLCESSKNCSNSNAKEFQRI